MQTAFNLLILPNAVKTIPQSSSRIFFPICFSMSVFMEFNFVNQQYRFSVDCKSKLETNSNGWGSAQLLQQIKSNYFKSLIKYWFSSFPILLSWTGFYWVRLLSVCMFAISRISLPFVPIRIKSNSTFDPIFRESLTLKQHVKSGWEALRWRRQVSNAITKSL